MLKLTSVHTGTDNSKQIKQILQHMHLKSIISKWQKKEHIKQQQEQEERTIPSQKEKDLRLARNLLYT